MDSVSFIHSLDVPYCEVTHWLKNNFEVLQSSAGRAFVNLIHMLFHSESLVLESIALKYVFVVCDLVLQKPSCTSKERDHIRHLEYRLKLWKELVCLG